MENSPRKGSIEGPLRGSNRRESKTPIQTPPQIRVLVYDFQSQYARQFLEFSPHSDEGGRFGRDYRPDELPAAGVRWALARARPRFRSQSNLYDESFAGVISNCMLHGSAFFLARRGRASVRFSDAC